MATDVVIAVGTRGVSAAARSITRLEDRTSKFGKAMAGAVVGGTLAAGVALAKFTAASVDAASKSQQSLGATETVFGKYARTVIRESRRADDAIGLSANEYRELANVLGASLNAAGIPLRRTTGLTSDLNKRAADVAATFGGSTREAVEAFGSALRGETDPIERYGVAIKEADVKARLAAKGQDKLTGAAGKQAAMIARLDLIFEQTSKTQGAFARESDTLAGAQQRLDAKIENLQAKFGKLLLPVLTDGVNLISRRVIPAAEDLAGWFATNQDEITRLVGSLRDGLLPPLQTLGGIASAAARFVADLPPEVQSLAAQAAVAAAVLPRLSAAIGGLKLSELAAGMRDAETRTAKFAAAARQAGGVAGIVALAHGTQQTNDALKTLETTAGGALLGFSLAGPWGAAVGAGAGAVASLWHHVDKSSESLGKAVTPAANYAAALDQVNGAATRVAHTEAARALQQQGAFTIARQLGISTQDVVRATLGEEAATRRVTKVFRDQLSATTATVDAYGNIVQRKGVMSSEAYKLAQILGVETKNFEKQVGKTRELSVASGALARELKGVQGRAKIVSRIETQGWPEAERDVRRLTRGLNLTPKQIRTVMRVLGVQESNRDLERVKRSMQETGRTKPDTAPWLRSLTTALTTGRDTSRRGVEGVARELQRGTRGAKADLGPFRTSLQGGITTARGNASTGGSGIGNALGSGVYYGIDGWAGDIAARAASMVRAAVSAARAAADAHSPSRKTMQLGRDMGAGLAIGMRQSQREVKVASFGIVQALVEGLTGTDSSSPVDSAISEVVSKVEQLYDTRLEQATTRLGSRFEALGNITTAHFDAVSKNIDKAEKRAEAKARKTLKGKELQKALRGISNSADRRQGRAEARQERAEAALRKAQQQSDNRLTRENRAQRKAALDIVNRFTPALRANADAQEAINAQLDDARSALASLQEQHAAYVAQVRDNVVSFGSIIGLGEGTGFGSVEQMLSMMRAKVAQAREYADLIKSLTAAGLNQTTIQQLIDAGVQGGLGTAQALASGGAAAIAEVNNLTAQLTAVGTDLGTTTANNLYGAGINAAQGLVNGLASQQAALVQQGNVLAYQLDAALAAATAETARKNSENGKNVGRQLAAGILFGIEDNRQAIDAAAKKLGRALTRAVKDELGIRSPSRVFAGIGENVVKGLDLGLDDTYVKRSGAMLAASLEKGFGAPRFEAMIGATVGQGGTPVQIVVQVPPTADKAAIGREIAGVLKAYVGAGGRVVTG